MRQFILHKHTNIRNFVWFIQILLFTITPKLTVCQSNNSIVFDKTIHDFGEFSVNSGEKRCSFAFTNQGKTPIVIQTVVSSCGCTAPDWTNEPILPGKKGVVNVLFMNDQGALPFEKSLSVYISGISKPIILRIKGLVIEDKDIIAIRYPIEYRGLRFKTLDLNVGQIMKGSVNTYSIEILNTTSQNITINSNDKSSNQRYFYNQHVIKKGEKVLFNITFNSSIVSDYGKLIDDIPISINGDKSKSFKISFSAIIIPDFRNISFNDKQNAPVPILNKTTVTNESIKSGTILQEEFIIKNSGKKDLEILKVEVTDPSVKVKFDNRVLSGSSGKINITFDTTKKIGKKIIILSLITNSPVRPVINLTIQTTIQ